MKIAPAAELDTCTKKQSGQRGRINKKVATLNFQSTFILITFICNLIYFTKKTLSKHRVEKGLEKSVSCKDEI